LRRRKQRRGADNIGVLADAINLAKSRKADEFYTLETDVKKELGFHRKRLRGKAIHCNCDDPRNSAFVKVLWRNFDKLGLERLIATHYVPPAGLFEPTVKPWKLDVRKGGPRGCMKDHASRLEGDGDFGSWEVKELTRQADIVITNPPFSKFIDFVETALECGADLLALGSLAASGVNLVFGMISEGRMRFGYNSGNNKMQFRVPEDYRDTHAVDGDGLVTLGHVRWYTTLPTPGKKLIDPTTSMNDYDDWKNCDGTDVLNVDSRNDIPRDYDGVMGVPMSYLEVHDPAKFEIVGKFDNHATVDGDPIYRRILIRRLT